MTEAELIHYIRKIVYCNFRSHLDNNLKSIDDLVSVAYLAAKTSQDKFDENRGTEAAFYFNVVRGAVCNYLRYASKQPYFCKNRKPTYRKFCGLDEALNLQTSDNYAKLELDMILDKVASPDMRKAIDIKLSGGSMQELRTTKVNDRSNAHSMYCYFLKKSRDYCCN